jgi:hypothetical protein
MSIFKKELMIYPSFFNNSSVQKIKQKNKQFISNN